jgi:hypothetical protein
LMERGMDPNLGVRSDIEASWYFLIYKFPLDTNYSSIKLARLYSLLLLYWWSTPSAFYIVLFYWGSENYLSPKILNPPLYFELA